MSAMTDGNGAKMWKWKLEQVVVEKLISLSYCNYSLTVQQAESVHTVTSDIHAQDQGIGNDMQGMASVFNFSPADVMLMDANRV